MMTEHSVVYPHTSNAKAIYRNASDKYERARDERKRQTNSVHICEDIWPDKDMLDVSGYKTFCGDYVDEKEGIYVHMAWTYEEHPTCIACLKEMERRNKRIISLYEQKDIYEKLQAIDKNLAKRILPMRDRWSRKRAAMEARLLAMRKEFPPEGAEEYMDKITP